MAGTWMLWFFDSEVLGFLVFCSVGLGLRGFLGCTWNSWTFSFFSGTQGFSLVSLFFLVFVGPLVFLFSFLVLGAQGF